MAVSMKKVDGKPGKWFEADRFVPPADSWCYLKMKNLGSEYHAVGVYERNIFNIRYMLGVNDIDLNDERAQEELRRCIIAWQRLET